MALERVRESDIEAVNEDNNKLQAVIDDLARKKEDVSMYLKTGAITNVIKGLELLSRGVDYSQKMHRKLAGFSAEFKKVCKNADEIDKLITQTVKECRKNINYVQKAGVGLIALGHSFPPAAKLGASLVAIATLTEKTMVILEYIQKQLKVQLNEPKNIYENYFKFFASENNIIDKTAASIKNGIENIKAYFTDWLKQIDDNVNSLSFEEKEQVKEVRVRAGLKQ